MTKARAATTAAAVTACCALLLTACGQDSTGGSKEEKGKKKQTIGVAMPTKSSERWIADGRNMTKILEKAGYGTTLQYGEDDPDQQVAQIENMITQGVDALVIAAINGEALSNVLQQAADADIPVISYDRLILGSPHVDYYASFDNEKVGR
ncbi:MAG: substrate-binding domain-containing protein, partial [Streptomyces albidoflavus]